MKPSEKKFSSDSEVSFFKKEIKEEHVKKGQKRKEATSAEELGHDISDQKLFEIIIENAQKKTKPKIELELKESEILKKAKIVKTNLYQYSAKELQQLTKLPIQRCEELVAVCQFQLLGSVGPSLAADMWRLGYKDIKQLAQANPAQMFQTLKIKAGGSMDPCVEDVFRCAAVQAAAAVKGTKITIDKTQWWHWMSERGEPIITINLSKSKKKIKTEPKDEEPSLALTI